MQDFVAIDFETANRCRTSACSVGLVRVEGGQIAGQMYRLIHPYPNYYLPDFTLIHGLSKADTDPAPKFPDLWGDISAFIGTLPLVAHNAPFDKSCLVAVLEHYGLGPLRNTFYCTLNASRRHFGPRLRNHQLHTVAAQCGYLLENHHHALADAEACAHIALQIL